MTVVMDGNFSLEMMKAKNPEDDVSLADGHGFMAEDGPYKAHLQRATESKQVRSHRTGNRAFLKHCHQRSTCHEHRAVNKANQNRHNLEATGVGATACARHGCFVPQAVVDFQKGERYAQMCRWQQWLTGQPDL